jgi:hypothetical protein
MDLERLKYYLLLLRVIRKMVDKAKDVKLLQQEFDYYEISRDQMYFPILSSIQHYGAPAPLIDWTYDINIA